MPLDEYDLLKARLSDRDWRIDNLYKIQNEDGKEVTFVRKDAQRTYYDAQWFFNILAKARQMGFSSLIEMMMLDMCLFNSNTAAGIIDLTLKDAKKKLAKVKFAYDRLPDPLKDAIPLKSDNTEAIAFGNGSAIEVGMTHRGGTLQFLHVSEMGPIAATSPDRARNIVTGAFGTVHAGGIIHVESTAAGTGGEFHDMVVKAENREKEKRPLSQLDFKLHFVPWWREGNYRLNPNEVLIVAEVLEYFEELEKKYKIKLDPAQRAWYAAQRNLFGPDDILREHPSHMDECFKSSIEGAYFKREMMKMRNDGRIGQMPHDPSRKVNTFWDIGHHDPNFIIFHQTDGVRHRLIDCYENDGEGLSHCVTLLKERKERYGYDYGIHYGPHDLENVEWATDENKSRKEIAASKGIHFEIIPRVSHIGDAIEAARRMLNMTWIDETKANRLVQCLDNYRKEWNDQRAVWREQPLHDWASHGASATMTGAMGFEPEMKPRKSRDKSSSASPWAA